MTCDYESDVDLEEGLEIVIDQAFPDTDCTYTITFAEGAENCLLDVLDNNGSIDFDGSKFVCKAGTEISLELDSGYKIDEITIGGEEQASLFPNIPIYNVVIPDMSVVKLFIKEIPALCEVSFEAAASCEAVVARDLIVPVTDLASGFECFAGTEVSVAAGSDAVKVNGETVTPDADGVCTFVVTADTKVSIGDAAGISDVMTDGSSNDDSVYNLQGVKVGTASEMGTLPAGLYISNGKKVIVK